MTKFGTKFIKRSFFPWEMANDWLDVAEAALKRYSRYQEPLIVSYDKVGAATLPGLREVAGSRGCSPPLNRLIEEWQKREGKSYSEINCINFSRSKFG